MSFWLCCFAYSFTYLVSFEGWIFFAPLHLLEKIFASEIFQLECVGSTPGVSTEHHKVYLTYLSTRDSDEGKKKRFLANRRSYLLNPKESLVDRHVNTPYDVQRVQHSLLASIQHIQVEIFSDPLKINSKNFSPLKICSIWLTNAQISIKKHAGKSLSHFKIYGMVTFNSLSDNIR